MLVWSFEDVDLKRMRQTREGGSDAFARTLPISLFPKKNDNEQQALSLTIPNHRPGHRDFSEWSNVIAIVLIFHSTYRISAFSKFPGTHGNPEFRDSLY